MLHRAFVPILLALLVVCATIDAAGESPSNVDGERITQTLRDFVDNGSLVGVSALITVDGS